MNLTVILFALLFIVMLIVCVVTIEEPREPLYEPKELYGIIPKDMKKSVDVRLVRRFIRNNSFLMIFVDYCTLGGW